MITMALAYCEHEPQHHQDDQVAGDRVAEKPHRQRERAEELAHDVHHEEDAVERVASALGTPAGAATSSRSRAPRGVEALVLGDEEHHDGHARR